MDENCHVDVLTKKLSQKEIQKRMTVGLAVWGMGCPNCANRVHNSLLSQFGVLDADVDHTTGLAAVEYNPDLISPSALLQAVANAGDNNHRYIASLLENPV